MKSLDESKYYVFYDGDCGFCNYWVQWILKNDNRDIFRFAALQSNFGQQFLRERNLSREQFNTIYLWKPGSFYLIKSQAISQIARLLGGKYRLLAGLNILPQFLTDLVYDKISDNRMKLSSAKCLLPTADEKKKFITE